MKHLKIISIAILSMAFLQACVSNNDNAVVKTPSMTIVETAVSTGNFTTLVAALQATGLDKTLADTSKKFTVFAPTDDAFALLGQRTINALLADKNTLTNILTYHVINSEVDAAAAISLAGSKVGMVNGDEIGLSLANGKLLVNTVTVTTTDIFTTNGVIHVIDAVLIPPASVDMSSQTIVDIAVADPDNLSTLVTALTAANLVSILEDENATFTVFAPTNSAFDKIDPDALADLLADTAALSDVLLAHVVSGSALSTVDAYTVNGMSLTSASGNKIAVSVDAQSGMLMIGGAKVITTDIQASNGIIHVIDTVILE